MLKHAVVLLLVTLSVMLAACGAETPPPSPPPTDPPPAATATPIPPPPTETPAPPPSPTPAQEEPAAPAESAPAAPAEAEPAAQSRTFVIVPEKSTASYIVDEEFFGGALDRLGIQPGLVKTIGRTQTVSGQMELNLADLAAPVQANQFTVDLSTLTSDQPRRDNRIREANLESATYPLAAFTITGLQNTPATYTEGQPVTFQALGDMTIREITQPVVFEVTATLTGDTITGTATAQLKMTDFGFEPPNFANMFSVEDEFTTQVEFTFQAQ